MIKIAIDYRIIYLASVFSMIVGFFSKILRRMLELPPLIQLYFRPPEMWDLKSPSTHNE